MGRVAEEDAWNGPPLLLPALAVGDKLVAKGSPDTQRGDADWERDLGHVPTFPGG